MTSTDQWMPDLDAEDPTEPDAGLHPDSQACVGGAHVRSLVQRYDPGPDVPDAGSESAGMNGPDGA